MKIEIKQNQNHQTYDVYIDDSVMTGEITNGTVSGKFEYQSDCTEYFNSEKLRLIASKLDELNNE